VKRPFLLVCGPRGVGKSSVGFQVFFEVMQSGIKAAYVDVDLDQVSFCRPIEDDPDTERVKARNLARIWSVYERAGARCLVASGDVGSSDVMDAHAAAVPTLALSICRLQAHGESLKERMLTRGRGDSAQLPGDELLGEALQGSRSSPRKQNARPRRNASWSAKSRSPQMVRRSPR
jgi:hypothetical protein